MGVVNVTPDSFSDGGRWADPEAAIAHGRQLVARRRRHPRRRRGVHPAGRHPTAGRRGARPGAPGDRGARGRRRGGLGRHHARRGRRAGASRPARGSSTTSPAGWPTRGCSTWSPAARRRTSPCTGGRTPTGCATSRRTTPGRRRGQRGPRRARRAGRRDPGRGHRPERVVLDPGLGFAKRPEHNWALLRGLDELHGLGLPAAGRREPQVVPRPAAGRADGAPRPVDEREPAPRPP